MTLLDGLGEVAAEVRARLGRDERSLAARFERWWLDTPQRAFDPRAGTVITGDIPAMWLRDSSAQVRPWLVAAVHHPAVADALVAVSRRQAACVHLDPYANAFVVGRRPPLAVRDRPRPGPGVWERKYEVDSLAAFLQLAAWIRDATGRRDHLDETFRAAADRVVALWRDEQDHDRSAYRFVRIGGTSRDRLARRGRGRPVARTGMTWSGFRPSDDACRYGYLVPSNMAAVVALRGVADLVEGAAALASEIEAGIEAAGTARLDGETIYAYEVDGLGHRLLMDDANVPSLLAIPYLGYRPGSDPVVAATRRFVLSPANPWFFEGTVAAGVGSPHTGPGRIWHLAIAMRGLTAADLAEAEDQLSLLLRTDGGTGQPHESFSVDDPADFTRPWFGWANALACELVLAVLGIDVPGTGFVPAWRSGR